jgi:hypothetical protein
MLELIENAKNEPRQPYFGVVTKDEIKWGETLDAPVKVNLHSSINAYAQYEFRLKQADSLQELQNIGIEITNSDLLWKEKKDLEKLGSQLSLKFNF